MNLIAARSGKGSEMCQKAICRRPEKKRNAEEMLQAVEKIGC